MTYSKLRCLKFKRFASRSVFGEASTHQDIIENFLLKLKNQRSGSKTACGFSFFFSFYYYYYYYFEKNYDVLKSKRPCFLLNKNIKFNKNETELKMQNPTYVFREMNHVLQLI